MADRDSLAIIIVTFNSIDEIGPCLQSVIGHTAPFPTTVTVVDNASTDGTVALVRERFPSVQVIDAGGNLGFAKAVNIGVRATDSDYVLLLNPDTVAPPGAIQALVRGLASNPEAAIAGPRLLNERGFPELSWGRKITPWNEAAQMILSRLYLRKLRFVVRTIDRLSRNAREVDWVSGACMAIRRADLVAAGLLDERYFMYNEDVDLCVTMKQRGRVTLYISGAELLHHRGRSAPKNPELERLRQKSHVAYYEKHLPAWTPLLRSYLKVTGKL